jgi:hypothetical protein
MRLTKKAMARVIVQAVYNLPSLPSDDHPMVMRLEKQTVTALSFRHRMACDVLHKKALAS